MSASTINDFSPLSCPGTILRNLISKDTSVEERGRIMFSKLSKYPTLRKSLKAINTARSYKYGSKTLGKNTWYSENFDVVKGLHSNRERRKFRFGLKSNVDFLLELDLANLKNCLLDKSVTQATTYAGTSSLSDGSLLSLMQKVNQAKTLELCGIINRLESNLKFTQSLSEHLANDDMLEPALLVVSDALRHSPDLGKGLWGRSVAANALLYRHRASSRDHEFKSGRTTSPHRPTSRISARKQKFSFENFKYPKGSCFRFQETGKCDKSNCTFDHSCCKCFSKNHGKESCPNNYRILDSEVN